MVARHTCECTCLEPHFLLGRPRPLQAEHLPAALYRGSGTVSVIPNDRSSTFEMNKDLINRQIATIVLNIMY
jgi:hypothetical protein